MASYSGCDRLAAILFFSFASGFAGLDNSRVNNMDLSPNYAPTIIAIVNSCGSVMGIIAPVAVGLLTPNVSLVWEISLSSEINWCVKTLTPTINFVLFIYW